MSDMIRRSVNQLVLSFLRSPEFDTTIEFMKIKSIPYTWKEKFMVIDAHHYVMIDGGDCEYVALLNRDWTKIHEMCLA